MMKVISINEMTILKIKQEVLFDLHKKKKILVHDPLKILVDFNIRSQF